MRCMNVYVFAVVMFDQPVELRDRSQGSRVTGEFAFVHICICIGAQCTKVVLGVHSF
jgi:hypothetical protein